MIDIYMKLSIGSEQSCVGTSSLLELQQQQS